jgi:hypothetical protein
MTQEDINRMVRRMRYLRQESEHPLDAADWLKLEAEYERLEKTVTPYLEGRLPLDNGEVAHV